MLQKQFLTDWKSRHFPLCLFFYHCFYFFFEGKRILCLPIVDCTETLVCNCFESYTAADPVTAVGWFQLLGVPTERKEIANTMSNYLIYTSNPPPVCVYSVCFLKRYLHLICSFILPYEAELVAQAAGWGWVFVIIQQGRENGKRKNLCLTFNDTEMNLQCCHVCTRVCFIAVFLLDGNPLWVSLVKKDLTHSLYSFVAIADCWYFRCYVSMLSLFTSVYCLTPGFEFKNPVYILCEMELHQELITTVCPSALDAHSIHAYSCTGMISIQKFSPRKSAYYTSHPENLQPFLLLSNQKLSKIGRYCKVFINGKQSHRWTVKRGQHVASV